MFQIDLTSHKSIYEQVIDKMKELITTEVLKTNSKLPSVRELSRELTVNPNTVQKAYKELERDGFVYTTSGIGTFVADKSNLVTDQGKVKLICEEVVHCYKSLQYLGLSKEDAKVKIINSISEEEEPNDRD